MDTQSFILAQLELECIRRNQQGTLERFPCANPDDAARLYIMRDNQTTYRYMRDDMPAEMRQLLQIIAADTLFFEHERIQSILLEHYPCTSIFQGKTYIFPDDMTIADDGIVYQDAGHLCGIMIEGALVAACSSVRENDYAAEAWVFTEEAYRHQGYGRRVVQAWAQRIRKLGKIPFYSHKLDNHASQRLAQSAGMQWIFDVVNYE